MRVVIVGGSFGGLTAAYELRRRLSPEQCDITLISRDRRFTFIPSLPWVALGSRSLKQISFELEPPLQKRDVAFVHDSVESVEMAAQRVITERGTFDYDHLVVATGHRSANEAVPGLGPFDGPGHSLMSPPEADEARTALQSFLDDPGPMVIGCAPGASCIGPAYEFAFEIDHLLRQRRRRHEVPITFVTPEPFLGHLGVGGVGNARQFLEAAFDERDIRYRTSVAVGEISANSVRLEDGSEFESSFSMVLPPLAGVPAIAGSPGLANPKGFIPVDDLYRHPEALNVHAVGVAVAMPPVDETEVPVNFPKTGHMTEQMATLVAEEIASTASGAGTSPRLLSAECILDMGSTAARISADPVRPPRNRGVMSSGRQWLWAKRAFERYYLWRGRRGSTASIKWGW